VRNLACRGSRSLEPLQRTCNGEPHIVVMAGKPTRGGSWVFGVAD
jgi:hypothetical protein